ncbi:MAG TPA: hypothetical protein VGR21_07575, partial [Cryptosporangiaceae bacterium]|nr:hypothetical protein [Cryptosporangiaceae bacterium]
MLENEPTGVAPAGETHAAANADTDPQPKRPARRRAPSKKAAADEVPPTDAADAAAAPAESDADGVAPPKRTTRTRRRT